MEKLKEEFSSDGQLMHHAVIAIIKQNEKYLLVNRETLPSGYSLVTGHVDEGENAEEALVREVKEEVGLNITKHQLIFSGLINNSECNKGAKVHKSFVYSCEVEGNIILNKSENKEFGWYAKEEIKDLKIGQFWENVLKEIKII